jgi:hypothetical protein
MSEMIYKKDYTTKAQKVKLIESRVLGRQYVEDLIYMDIVDFDLGDEYNLPVKEPAEVEAYIHNHFYSIVNKNIDQVWEAIWEDLSYA